MMFKQVSIALILCLFIFVSVCLLIVCLYLCVNLVVSNQIKCRFTWCLNWCQLIVMDVFGTRAALPQSRLHMAEASVTQTFPILSFSVQLTFIKV